MAKNTTAPPKKIKAKKLPPPPPVFDRDAKLDASQIIDRRKRTVKPTVRDQWYKDRPRKLTRVERRARYATRKGITYTGIPKGKFPPPPKPKKAKPQLPARGQ